MNVILFLVEPIFTEADDLESVPAQVRGAVRCHFTREKFKDR